MKEWTTKFDLDQKVYKAETSWEKRQVECPDCKGEKVWHTTTPAGEKIESPCPTCRRGFDGSLGVIFISDYEPRATPLTVGQVRFQTDRKETEISYMMKETGVGSGSVHNERDIFVDKEEALKRAKELTVERKLQERKDLEKRQKHLKKESIRKGGHQ